MKIETKYMSDLVSVTFDFNDHIIKSLKNVEDINNKYNIKFKPKILFNVTNFYHSYTHMNVAQYNIKLYDINIDIDILNKVKYISELKLYINDNTLKLLEYIVSNDLKDHIKCLSLINPNLKSIQLAEQFPNLESLRIYFHMIPNMIPNVYLCEFMYEYLLTSTIIDKLKTLSLGNINYDEINLTLLCQIANNIEELYISDITTKYSLFNTIKNMHNLKLLDILNYRKLSSNQNDFFDNLKLLHTLYISHLNEVQCKSLSNLKQLHLKDEIFPDSLGYLKKLSVLSINNNLYYRKECKYSGNTYHIFKIFNNI
jgi:hypothetical protein